MTYRNITRHHYTVLGIAIALFLAWRAHLLVYACLFLLGLLLIRYRSPDLGWPKAVGTGLFLSLLWYLANLAAFFSLAPLGELGLIDALSGIAKDLVAYPEIVGRAFSYTQYRGRLYASAAGLGLLAAFAVNSPLGRDLGLHRIFELSGGYKLSKLHSLGSARWAGEGELRRFFRIDGPGLVLGKNTRDEPYVLPYNHESFDYQRNHNILVFGATGAGKSDSFVRPNILQADTSFVITDPKEELYGSMAPFLEGRGYDVYKLNLVNMKESNRWNPLVKKDGSRDLSVQDAVLIASSIIKNTRGPHEQKGDPFWEKSEQALLTALLLYASRYFDGNPSFGNILQFAVGRPGSALNYDFERLQLSDPARAAYNVYAQAPEKVRGSVIVSLGTRLQLWQDDLLTDITSRSDFDLTRLGEKKTAVFVAISDFDSTYHSVSALFFTQAFQELYRLASKNNGTLPVMTRFLMDEFCNIGYIPDFTVKLSTMRSRGICAQMVVQSLSQLENRYPFGQDQEIIGNCDTKLMLGANDAYTADYIVDLIGKTTVEQHSRSRTDKVAFDAGGITRRETGRHLITPDELLRLDNREALLLVRGIHPAKIRKLYYREHPAAVRLPDPIEYPGTLQSRAEPQETDEDRLVSEIISAAAERPEEEVPDFEP